MIKKRRSLVIRVAIIIITIILGLGSRYYSRYLPKWINLYFGDFLWAFMMFFIIAIIFRNSSTLKILVTALVYCYLIEISQIYHSPWIDNIRGTIVGHLILGRGFLWSDLLLYTIGILTASFIDYNLDFNL